MDQREPVRLHPRVLALGARVAVLSHVHEPVEPRRVERDDRGAGQQQAGGRVLGGGRLEHGGGVERASHLQRASPRYYRRLLPL